MIRACLVAALLLLPRAHVAAQPGVSVVVEAGATDPLARRLRAELGARGYAVSAVELEEGTLEAVERADGALARGVGGYVRVESERAIVCARRIADGALRCEPIDRAVGDDLATLQIVEVLRARLLGASAPPEEPAEDEREDVEQHEAAQAPPIAPQARAWPRMEMEVTLGATVPVDGTTPSLDSRVAIGVAIDPAWSIRLWGRLPWLATRAEAPEGAADLRARLVGLEVALAIPLDEGLGVELAAFVAGGWLEAAGEATASDDVSVTAGLFLAGLSAALSIELLRHLAVLVRASVGWTAPTPVVQFGAREVARWGAPWIAIDLGLRALVP